MAQVDRNKQRLADECLHHAGVQLSLVQTDMHRARYVHADGLTQQELAYLARLEGHIVKCQAALRKLRDRTQHGRNDK